MKTKDMIGERYGQLTVTGQLCRKTADQLGLRKGAHWNCICDCGKARIVFGYMLRSGQVTACASCTRSAKGEKAGARLRIDVTGERYGMLVAVRREATGEQGASWRFACDCGQEAVIRLKDVRYGNTLSCGCLKNADGFRHGQPKLLEPRPWRDTPTTYAKNFEAVCAGIRIEVTP